MGKRNGLAVFALLIAFGGLGLGIYSAFILPNIIIAQTTNNSEIIQIWTVEQPTVYYTTISFVDVPDMDLTITVNTGESVLILFNGQFIGNLAFLIGGVRLIRDNVEIPNSKREFNIASSAGVQMGYSLSTNVLIDNLAAGNYEIKVQAFGGGINHHLDDGILIIYTFI